MNAEIEEEEEEVKQSMRIIWWSLWGLGRGGEPGSGCPDEAVESSGAHLV